MFAWVVAATLAVPAFVACTSSPASVAQPASRDLPGKAGPLARICGQPILDSPYHYDGAAGTYRSGTAGLPTYGTPGSDFPHDTAGVILPPGNRGYMSYDLSPDTVYYLLPGEHDGFFQADAGDAFVGGFAAGRRTVVSGNYSGYHVAIDSNFSDGNQADVTIEYLTIEKFQPNGDAAAINQSSNTGWTVRYNTITLNVPGAGLIAGADNTLKDNCLTLNGQYGFQSSDVGTWGNDSLTGGPYNVTVTDNEISYNDTCDFEGLFSNPAIGWSKYNPVPARYRNPHCGQVTGDGNQGGFKLWATNGVTIDGNYIHDNWGPGIWADTDNANTTYSGNTITRNDGQAIIEEISYNFSITNNYLADNGWAVGLSNPGFPTPAIYVSESGSDAAFGGIPACRETSCAGQNHYQDRSVISHNILVDNGGSVLLWQNSDRFCTAAFDNVCTLVAGGRSGPFTQSGCKANLNSASTDTTTYLARRTGSPSQDWWNGCLWKTENVSVTNNTVYFNPADITHCDASGWPACGAGGMFSEYGIAAPYDSPGGWVIASQLTFFQGNIWADNDYVGPSTFYAWNQGNGANPVSWTAWTGAVAKGDKCGSAQERQSGACPGPFGQDSGSTYRRTPHS
ncbi:MAG TPA: right-handed parallel beta-helix repeat-containing protein [Streptosporangiaceae bacterium]|nr:right-handed parallel beta-helix repeat-containing protein [Streptosporangiaceae bacterium]